MTKKNFEWFAAWLEQYPNLLMDYDALDDLMAMFHAANPRFKRNQFLTASGFSEEEVLEIWGEEE